MDQSAATASASASAMELRISIGRRWLQQQSASIGPYRRSVLMIRIVGPYRRSNRPNQSWHNNPTSRRLSTRTKSHTQHYHTNSLLLLLLLFYNIVISITFLFIHTQACGNRIIIVRLWCGVTTKVWSFNAFMVQNERKRKKLTIILRIYILKNPILTQETETQPDRIQKECVVMNAGCGNNF